GQGIFNQRLRLDVRAGDHLRLELHHALAALAPGGMTTGTQGPIQTGVVPMAPEAVDLSWAYGDGEDLRLLGRIDRAQVTIAVEHVDLTLGRQPISFGHCL